MSAPVSAPAPATFAPTPPVESREIAATRRRSSSTLASGPFVVVGHGAGGIDELRGHLDEREVAFGLLRSVVGSGTLARTKHVLLHFRGANCPAMWAMRLTARRAEAAAALGGATVEFACERRDGATLDVLLGVLQKCCVADDGGAPSLSTLREDVERQVAEAQSTLRQRMRHGGEAGKSSHAAQPRAKLSSLPDTLAKVRAPTGPLNWLLVDAALKMLAAGGGSVDEMREAVPEDRVAFGMLRVAFGVGAFRRCYWLFVHWTGPKCSAIKRGQANVQRGAAGMLLQPASLTLFAGAPEELSAEAVIDKVRQACLIDEELASDVASVYSRQAFFQAIKEDEEALFAELGLEPPTAEPTEPSQPGWLSVSDAVRAVRADEDPLNWVLIAVEGAEQL